MPKKKKYSFLLKPIDKRKIICYNNQASRGNILVYAAMAQLVEHILGKDEVPSSNLGSSSRQPRREIFGALAFYRGFRHSLRECLFVSMGLSGAATQRLTGDGHAIPSGRALSRRVHRTLHSSNPKVASDNIEEKSSGLWLSIGVLGILSGSAFLFFGVVGSCYSRFELCSALLF